MGSSRPSSAVKVENHLVFLRNLTPQGSLSIRGYLSGGDSSREVVLQLNPSEVEKKPPKNDQFVFQSLSPYPYRPLELCQREKKGILEILGLPPVEAKPTFKALLNAFGRFKRLNPRWQGADIFVSSQPEVDQFLRLVRPRLGNCGDHSRAGQAVCAALGVKSRQLVLSAVDFHSSHQHGTLEVYTDDRRRWIILDPMLGVFPTHNGRSLSLLDLWNVKSQGLIPKFEIAGDWTDGLGIDPAPAAELNLIDRAEFLVNGPDNYIPLSDLNSDRKRWECGFHPNTGGIGHRLFRIEKDVWMVKLIPERVKFDLYRIHTTDKSPVPLLNWQVTPLGEPRPFGQLSRYRFRRNSRSMSMEIVDSRNHWTKLKPPSPLGTGIPGLPESRIYTYDGVGGLSWRFGALEGKLNQVRLKIRILTGRCRMILKSGDFIYSVSTFDRRCWSWETVTFFGGPGETELRLETSEFARFQIGTAGLYHPSPH
jgi:hypothetical protein